MMSIRGNTVFAIVLMFSMLTGVGTTAASEATEPVDQIALDDLAAYIDAARVQWDVPGVAVTIVNDDRVVMTRGFGVREAGKAASVDEHTIFALSSMGKAFAAAAVASVVDEGSIGWDDPIVEHLPWFQMPDAWVTRQVTVRDLLAHKSGMGDEIWGATSATREAVVRRARYMNQVAGFRADYNYSNVGITAAGLAAAAAAGADWHTLMTERVLRPLNMTSSTTDLKTLWDPADVAPCYLCEIDHPVGIGQSHNDNIVMPHVWRDGEVRPIAWRTVENIAPAGSINSNAVDMAKWLRMHLGRGIYDGRRILSEDAVDEMHTPQNVIRPEQLPVGATLVEAEDRFHFWAYGLGWRMNDFRGRKMVWHTGGITGFSSIMALLPDANVGVSVLTNSWRSSPELLVYAIVLRIFDEYLGVEPHDWSTELLARSEDQRALQEEMMRRLEASLIQGTSPTLPQDAYTGRYGHPAHDDLVLESRDGELILRFASGLTGILEHRQYDTFGVKLQSPGGYVVPATFVLDARRQVEGLRLEGFAEFRRLPD